MIQEQKETSFPPKSSLLMEIVITGLLIMTHMHTFRISYSRGTGAISYGSPVRITFSWEKTLR